MSGKSQENQGENSTLPMKIRKKKNQIDEIIKEENNIFWWLRRDLTTLSIETSEGMELSLAPAQKDEWDKSIYTEVRTIASFLKTHSALLLPDDMTMAVIVYKKLNNILWETKELTSQYAKEKLEITDILTDQQKAILLVHNKTAVLDGYNRKGESSASTVRDEAISALSRLITADDKHGYHERVIDIFLDVIENRDTEKWGVVQSAILGLWPFPSETIILIELLFQPVTSEKIAYDELVAAEAVAVTLKNQAIHLPGILNEHRSHVQNILNLAQQEYLKKKRVLEKNLVKNKDLLESITIICHRLSRCLEEIEQVKIQEEKEKHKKIEKKKIEIQNPIEIFINKEALTFISLLRDNKKEFVEYFLNDPRHFEIHLSYVQRCIEIISDETGDRNELKLWLADHPISKKDMLSFFKKMEDELSHKIKYKLSCSHPKKKIKEKGEISKCPICGTNVNVEKTEQMVMYEGIIYYFCCACCKSIFDEEPAKYHQILGGKL